MSKIVVIGSLNMDLVAHAARLPRAGETLIGTAYRQVPGGKGANQAYAAARLGGEVAMLGCIGSDAHGIALRSNLEAVGCDVSGIRVVKCPSGVAMIMVDESGENSIVVIPGANALFGTELIQDSTLRGASHCLLQLEIPHGTVGAAIAAAKRCGASVILDPAPAPQSLGPLLLQGVDILTPNEVEATALLGQPSGKLDREAARAVASGLRSLGAVSVLLKLGAQGCYYSNGVEDHWVQALMVKAVDTTAAGDVFNGAFAVACSEGASIPEACRFAVAAAAISVTRMGAQPSMPSRSEVSVA